MLFVVMACLALSSTLAQDYAAPDDYQYGGPQDQDSLYHDFAARQETKGGVAKA